MNESLTARGVAELVAGVLEGDPDARIDSIAALDSAGPNELSFARDEKYLAKLAKCKAGVVLIPKDSISDSAQMTLIRVDDVQVALSTLLEHFAPQEDLPAIGVHDSAVVSPDAELADDVRIGPGVVIAAGAKIGRRTALLARVSIGPRAEIGEDALFYEGVSVRWGCKVGKGVRIGPNTVIGYDGFGYYLSDGVQQKIPHAGNVVLEDGVEIGACTCIDRAKFGSTRIGAGTKIDNLVQIGHNVQMGRACILAALVGIGGSTRLGDHVILLGHVGIRDNISIGSGVMCGAYTAVAEDVPAGKKMFGIPAIPGREKFRQISLTSRLRELFSGFRDLEKRLSALEPSEDHQKSRDDRR